MSISKLPFVILSVGVSFSAFAFTEVRLVTSHPEILEVASAYPPGPFQFRSTRPTVVMPQQKTFSQFGGLYPEHSFTLEHQKQKLLSTNPPITPKIGLVIPVLYPTPRPVCGASPEQNTINCFDLNKSAQYLGSYPLPGAVSTTPVFFEGSWLLGTTKGFLLRVAANEDNNYLPALGDTNTALWGAYSRKYMSSFRPKPIYVNSGKKIGESNSLEKTKLPASIKWVFPSSSEFVGTPIVRNGFVYVFSANEYLQAFHWDTGKLAWALRLAPDVNLRLASNALVVTSTEVIVGTDLGTVLVLNPKTGAILWSWQLQGATSAQRELTQLPAGPDRFSSIVASPLILGRNLIVSNAESMTQSISLDSKAALWSYPMGSVAQPKVYKESVVLGSSNGKVISLNSQTGEVLWTTHVTTDSSPIMSLFITKSNVILAASSRGQIFMLDPEKGNILAKNLPIGESNGEFFAGFGDADACLTFSQDGFRCFRAKVK